MVDLNNLSFGQRIDTENGLVESWFTHGALDAIKSIDLSDKIIVMYGSGLGDIWLGKRCKELHVIERMKEWVIEGEAKKLPNMVYYYRPCNDCSGMDVFYTAIPPNIKPDVVIVDDAYRYECLVKATTLERPLIVIADNWMQSYVFMCPAGVELMKDFKQEIYEQHDHKDNDGINKWKTAIFWLT